MNTATRTGPVPYNLEWPRGYVYCHADGHGHRGYGDETYENTAYHKREDSTLIEWPNRGGALWHCPLHADHKIRDGKCEGDPFPRTRHALNAWDVDVKPALQALWDAVETNDDVAECEAADATARIDVVDAFALDTLHVNRWSDVHGMTVADVRDIVTRYDER